MSATLPLSAGEVHLWLCHRDRVVDSDDFKRQVLSRYCSIAPGDWMFELVGEGKPVLSNTGVSLSFNLSHSGQWLACAIANDGKLGVDLESLRASRDVMKLALRFFCEEEIAQLEACEPSARGTLFYELWTLKEAAVKARAEALPPALAQRGFSFSQAGGILSIDPVGPGPDNEGCYLLLEPLPDYRLALCSILQARTTTRVRQFQWHDAHTALETPLAVRAMSAGYLSQGGEWDGDTCYTAAQIHSRENTAPTCL